MKCKEERYFVLPFAELVDRLSVDQIKEVLFDEGVSDIRSEITDICNDLDQIITNHNLSLSSQIIRVIIALSQLNVHIWNLKDQMNDDVSRYDELLKRAHQLNGIRNQLKNALLEMTADGDAAKLRSNIDIDGLEGWVIKL